MSLAAYDAQAKADMAAYRKRTASINTATTAAKTVRASPVSSKIKVNILTALLGGELALMNLATAAGYGSGGAIASAVERSEVAGLISVRRTKKSRRGPSVFASITPAGREWLAQNGGAQ